MLIKKIESLFKLFTLELIKNRKRIKSVFNVTRRKKAIF